MTEKFDPRVVYDDAVDAGCRIINKEAMAEYNLKREENLKNSSIKYIISPSRASFFRDLGGDMKAFCGKCQRQSFLDEYGATVTNMPSAVSLRRMKYGQIYETQEHLYEEAGGILIAKNLRLLKQVSDDTAISGELDTLANLNGHKYIVEIKSYDGYFAVNHIQGTKTTPGMPKYEHIAQNMFYLAMLREQPEHKDTEGTIFHYRTRGDLVATYHVMDLETVTDSSGKVVDAYPIINGCTHRIISLRDLITRGIYLANYIKNGTLPPREPDYRYTDDKIKYLVELGDISKNMYTKWQQGKQQLGDWQCSKSYCPYFNLCMGRSPDNPDTWPSDKQVLEGAKSPVLDTITQW